MFIGSEKEKEIITLQEGDIIIIEYNRMDDGKEIIFYAFRPDVTGALAKQKEIYWMSSLSSGFLLDDLADGHAYATVALICSSVGCTPKGISPESVKFNMKRGREYHCYKLVKQKKHVIAMMPCL